MVSTVITVILLLSGLYQERLSVTEKKGDHFIQTRAEITSQEIRCINTFLSKNLGSNAEDCINVTTQLVNLYDSFDVVSSISSRVALFPEFCRPQCGRVIINAWQSCNIYTEIEDVANLLIGMCASDRGSTCYRNFNNLVVGNSDGKRCFDDLINTGQCSSQCPTILARGTENYGCCSNVLIRYQDSQHGGVEEGVNQLFSECGVSRPTNCTNNPLLSSPASSTSCSAASHIGIFTTVAFACMYLY